MRSVLLMACCIVTGAGGNLLLKAGMNKVGTPFGSGEPMLGYFIRVFTTPHILAGIALYVSSFVVWLVVLSTMDISKAYPFFVAGSFLIVMVAGGTLLVERLTAARIVAAAFILGGIILGSRT